MLIKEICIQCWEENGSEEKIADPGNEGDDERWDMGSLLCVVQMSRNALLKTCCPPPKECPFYLEHKLAEQEGL